MRLLKYHMQLNPDTDDQVQPSPRPPSDATELGDRAYAIAQAGDYEMAKEDKNLCTYLTRHCVLCNKFLGSSRAYTSHMRHHHQAALQDAISLGLQRCKQYNAMTSPCQFCDTEFTRAHMCIACTQLAVLEVQNQSTAMVHKCYICAYVADDRTALKRHLCREHQFSLFDWKPSRDSLADQQTCAHCGHLFHCMEGLRKHIIYGHCSKFDPDRAWTRCGDTDIQELFVKGTVPQIIADADMKKRLTLNCQFCNDTYQMVKHTANHMYVHHGELTQQADRLCHLMKDLFLPVHGCICNLHGCVCNPQVKKLQQAHVCLPFLQMAMLHFQRGDWLYVPIEYTDAVRDSMITHVPINSILHVCDCLRDREFQKLLEDDSFCNALRTRCLLCGKILTVGGPSAEHDLARHLHAEHSEPRQAIDVLIEMLQYFHDNDSERTCEWCLADLTQHADGDIASHLTECGPIRNLIVWLCSPLLQHTHGSRKSRSTSRSTGADGTRLSQKRPPAEAPTGTAGHTIMAAFKRQQLGEHPKSAATDGPSADTTRSRLSSHSESNISFNNHWNGRRTRRWERVCP